MSKAYFERPMYQVLVEGGVVWETESGAVAKRACQEYEAEGWSVRVLLWRVTMIGDLGAEVRL